MTVSFKGVTMGVQGDVAFTRITELPEGLNQANIDKQTGTLVVAHSETGHHHAIAGGDVMEGNCALYDNPENELESFLVVFGENGVELKHHRSYDPHQTVHFDEGTYRINRQREYTPEGYRRVAD